VMLGAHVRTSKGAVACAVGFDRKEEHACAVRAMALLGVLGLASSADRPAGSLPYGHQRRLEIARALASDPTVLLLDEPAAGMNKSEAADLAQIIKEVRTSFDVTVVLIDHDMDFVMNLCDDVTVLNFGRVIAEGKPDSIQRNDAVAAAYLGTPGNSQGGAP
jgi:branched-chain amino acid transport system ATP-binding protein